MKVNFPEIRIAESRKKVYAADLSGGGQEPYSLRLNYIDSKDSLDFELNTTVPITVTIGSFFTFRGYAVSSTKKQSVSSGFTRELNLVDTSIILDKFFVGLKGKYGGVAQPFIRRSSNLAATNVPSNINLNNLYSTPKVDPNTNDLAVFLSDPSDSNLILVGSYIDPCLNEDGDLVKDQCDPCSPEPQSNIDCAKSRNFEILDVDYSFSELLTAIKEKNINFLGISNYPNDYRNQYTGSLREVLNNWCQDFGWTFYWDGDNLNFFSLSQGINIDNINLENSLNCKIEEFSESKSIEGVKKTVNIAYFGKAGEVKNYTCSTSSPSTGGSSGKSFQCTPITTNFLWEGNEVLQKAYGEDIDTFEKILAASRLSETIRRIAVFYDLYGLGIPSDIIPGKIKYLGWDIKAVVDSSPSEERVAEGYNVTNMKALYALLSKSYDLFDKAFLDGDFINDNYFFLIVKPFSDGGYSFEKIICEKFTGAYSYNNLLGDPTRLILSSEDGEVIPAPPDLNATHHLIRSNKKIAGKRNQNEGGQNGIHYDKTIITVKGTVNWPSNPDDQNVEEFLQEWSKKMRKIDIPAGGQITIKEGDEVWMMPQFPKGAITYNGIKFDMPPENNDLGTKRKYTRAEADGGGGSNSQGSTTLIMPKIEIIKLNSSANNNQFTSVQVNYQNITNNNLSNIIRGTQSCYIDEGKIINYALSIIGNLNTSFPVEKVTKNYSILGLPDQRYTFADGLTSFSIRLDQSGTRTSLSFSNLIPSEVSDTIKKNQLNYLIKNNSNNKYINNTFK